MYQAGLLVKYRKLSCSVDTTINDGTCFRTLGYIGKQEVLTSHHKGFDAAFGPVVADFKPAILQIVEQMGPVLSRVLYSLSQQ
jgi:hypothetical protein